jgi:hypothetical protein
MTTNYDAAIAALSTNEELRKKVMSSTSAEERAGHLRDHGLDLPTHEEINRRHSDLADVTGAGGGGNNTTAAAPAVPVVAIAVAGAAV